MGDSEDETTILLDPQRDGLLGSRSRRCELDGSLLPHGTHDVEYISLILF